MATIGKVSVPGKVILFGEHAVVYGEPALSMAISRRMDIELHLTSRTGWFESHRPIDALSSPYIVEAFTRAIKRFGKPGVSVNMKVQSKIPPASGLGSSAAITVGTILSVMGALKYEGRLSGELDDLRPTVASMGHEVEASVQGSASPVDTTTVTFGGGILVGKRRIKGYKYLWTARMRDKTWVLHGISIPEDLHFVLGYTGIKGSTSELVARVRTFVTKNSFGREIIEEIGTITMDGVKALRAGDAVKLGELMTRNHHLLSILGVSHPMLDKLVDAVLPHSYGAKLTGAGGGGCMIALVRSGKINRVVEIIRNLGATPYIADPSRNGGVWEIHSSSAKEFSHA